LDLTTSPTAPSLPVSSAVQRLGGPTSWATLRAARFLERPSHADQLHVDLWWQGQNIALDAGTFRYTAPPPWDNSLAETQVHNTITVNHRNQMQRAGRFLWLDWAQARLLIPTQASTNGLTAEHSGYARIGVLHHRTLALATTDHWQITDTLLPASGATPQRYQLTVHWLLPDWPWKLEEATLSLSSPQGRQIRLAISNLPSAEGNLEIGPPTLVRAGGLLAGAGPTSPVMGWYSPTYNHKLPALAFSQTFQSELPLVIVSDWSLG
jgi:hypothetical protein